MTNNGISQSYELSYSVSTFLNRQIDRVSSNHCGGGG